jgi:hypothetical protein
MAFIEYKHIDGSKRFVMATVDGWFQYTAATETWTDITEAGNPLTGSRANEQVFRVFPMSGVTTLIGVNGQDAAKKWDGTSATYEDLDGSPPIGKCIAVAFNRVMMANLLSGPGESPYGIDVSAVNNPESGWGGDNVALLADTPGEIVVMLEMGNLLTAIHKKDATYVAVASPSLYPFTYELKQAETKGPVSALAALKLSDALHIWLSDDGSIQRFDSITVSSVSRSAQVHIQRTMNRDHMAHAFGFYDPRREEIWFFYPTLAAEEPYGGIILSKNNASIWPIKWSDIAMAAAARIDVSDSLTFGDLALAHTTFGEMEATFNELDTSLSRLIFAGTDGQCYQETGHETDDNGTEIGLICETGFKTLSKNPKQYVQVDEVDHLFEPASAAQDVTIELGVSDDGRDPTFTDSQTVDIGDDGPYVTEYRTEGRMVAMKMTADATQPVIWRGSAATGRVKGTR